MIKQLSYSTIYQKSLNESQKDIDLELIKKSIKGNCTKIFTNQYEQCVLGYSNIIYIYWIVEESMFIVSSDEMAYESNNFHSYFKLDSMRPIRLIDDQQDSLMNLNNELDQSPKEFKLKPSVESKPVLQNQLTHSDNLYELVVNIYTGLIHSKNNESLIRYIDHQLSNFGLRVIKETDLLYDSKVHISVGTVRTDNLSLHNKVESIVKVGLIQSDETVLYSAKVTKYTFKQKI